jgi:hypothetical protein
LFWYSRLLDGTLLKMGRPVKNYGSVSDYGTEYNIKKYRSGWDDRIPTQLLFAEYKMFVKEMGRRDYITDVHFVRGLKKICPDLDSSRIKLRPDEGDKKKGHIMIPPLGKCRLDFEKSWNAKIEW